MDNKIKIKCINRGGYYLTPDKIYLAKLVESQSELTPNLKLLSYKLKNDKGVEFYSETENFITINEWRESQLNKILN